MIPLIMHLAMPQGLQAHPQDGPHVDLRIEIGETDVAFEVVVNLAFADELVPPARENLDVLHPVERETIQRVLRIGDAGFFYPGGLHNSGIVIGAEGKGELFLSRILPIVDRGFFAGQQLFDGLVWVKPTPSTTMA